MKTTPRGVRLSDADLKLFNDKLGLTSTVHFLLCLLKLYPNHDIIKNIRKDKAAFELSINLSPKKRKSK